jgi:hypothetical protein
MEMCGQLHAPAALLPWKEFLGPRTGLNTLVRRKNSSRYRDSNLPIIEPVILRTTIENKAGEWVVAYTEGTERKHETFRLG